MEKNQFKQKWNEFKHKMRNKWDKLTDSDISEINGDYERFLNKMHKKHGYSREQAEREFHNWHMEGEGRTDREYGRQNEGRDGQFGNMREEGTDREYGRQNEGRGGQFGNMREEGTDREYGSQEGRYGQERGMNREYGREEREREGRNEMEKGHSQKDTWHKEGDRLNEGHRKEKGFGDQKKEHDRKNQEPGKKGPRGWDEGNEKKRKAG